MSAENYANCLALTLKYEGGKVDDPHDPGGRTAYGVTQRVYDAFRLKRGASKRDVYLIAEDEKLQIYREQYWLPIRGDELPDGVDLVVFDFAVNSGVSRAAKALQAVVGGRQDGIVGAVTLAAVKNITAGQIVQRVCDNRMTFLQKLDTWARYGKGWTARVKAVRAAGLQMVGKPGVTVAQGPSVPQEASAKAETTDVAPSKTGAGKATIVTGTVAAGTAAASAGDVIAAGKSIQSFSDTLPWLAVLGSIVVVIGIAWFLWPEIKRFVRGQGKEEVA